MRVVKWALLLSLLLVFSWVEVVQAPMDAASGIQWVQTLGGGTARCIQSSQDGGYLLSGWKKGRPGAGSAIFLIKTDSLGNRVWETVLPGNGFSCGYALCSGSRGSMIVVGDTKSKTAPDHDVFVAEVDADGYKIWERNVGGPRCDYGAAVISCRDGGFLVLGGTESYGAGAYDFYLIRLDQKGRTHWTKTYGGAGSDCGYALVSSRDGGYLLAGSSDSTPTGKSSICLIKIDELGNICWQQRFGSSNCYAWALQSCPDGTYLAAGEKEELTASGGGFKSCLLKIDSQGRLLWEHTYGGSSYSTAYALVQDLQGRMLLLGRQESADRQPVLHILKTDSAGASDHSWAMSGLGPSCAYAGLQSLDGGFVIAGQSSLNSNQKIILLKLAPEGLPSRPSAAVFIILTVMAGAWFFEKRKTLDTAKPDR